MSQARPGPRNQRAILDRRRLAARLQAVAREAASAGAARAAVLVCLKAAL